MYTYLLFLCLFYSGKSAECTEEDIIYDFSECSPETYTRTAYFYKKTDCEGNIPQPIPDLSCLLQCPVGHFLDIDLIEGGSRCSTCPANTFSIGGGIRVQGMGWAYSKEIFERNWWSSTWDSYYDGYNCSNWFPNRDYLQSGNSQLEQAAMESQLIYNSRNVKPGKLKIKYKKNSKMVNGQVNGFFAISINEDYVLENDDLELDDWQIFETDLDEGFNSIIITYQFFDYGDSEDMVAYIEYIEVWGTESASHSCYDCDQGYSAQGSSECSVCDRDEFLEGHLCEDCPHGTYSPRGTIGEQGCKKRQQCTNSDIMEEYTDCVNNTRSRVYGWRHPIICDTENSILPENQDQIPCEVCNPGFRHNPISEKVSETRWSPCPDGTYNEDFGDEWVACSPGSYAPKMLNYTDWSPLPYGFSNKCIPMTGDECEKTTGWIESDLTLMSGPSIDLDVSLTLQRQVNITDDGAYAEFTYSLENVESPLTKLYFMIDGATVGAYTNNVRQVTTSPFYLSRGLHILQWIYKRSSEEIKEARDNCYIHSIRIFGTNEGGATQCLPCPDGKYSETSVEECNSCPAGDESTEDHMGWELCPYDTIRETHSTVCARCPDNTMPNQHRTAWISNGQIILERDLVFDISDISIGSGEVPSKMCSRESVALYCHETFIGPIENDEISFFYISVLNPSIPTIQSQAFYNVTERLGYSYAILPKSDLLGVSASRDSMDLQCKQDSDSLMVNLGAQVRNVTRTSNGFDINYDSGDFCNPHSFQLFSTQINFQCDLAEDIGWPKFIERRDCTFVFSWKSIHACSTCGPEDLTLVKSACLDGTRKVHQRQDNDCRLIGEHSYTEECSTFGDVIKTWQVIVGLLCLALLFVAVGCSLVCYCRVKRRYQKLADSMDVDDI